MDGFARAKPGSAENERAFEQLELAAQLFDQSSATRIDVPGWGHAEAYLGARDSAAIARRCAGRPQLDREVPDRRARLQGGATADGELSCGIDGPRRRPAPPSDFEPGIMRRDEATRHAIIAVRDAQLGRPIRGAREPARAPAHRPRARRRTGRNRGSGRRQRETRCAISCSDSRPGSIAKWRPCSASPNRPRRCRQSIEFAYTGERFEVEWQRSAEALRSRSEGDAAHRAAPDDGDARLLLQGWLKRAADERLAPRLLELGGRIAIIRCERVVIRCQRTRWGSCSTRGTVSLNCSLVFLRPEVVRYLFVHELAHT